MTRPAGAATRFWTGDTPRPGDPTGEGLACLAGIGGVTDAELITAEEGERLLAEFIAAGPMGDPDLR
jgi:hypothetical protein